ncbi:MAG: PTS sugar transporter subunit IIA [Proteobacteria bacterium]|jgi:PTS system nitrogen regulatory IIA component|nr:PTS sugar transporter subunit IIA [Pseudomonadota bacterium]
MNLTDFISERSVSCELVSTDKKRVLAELSALLAAGSRGVRDEEIVEILEERERVATTGIGGGVAIPHGKAPGIPRLVAAVGVSREGVPFDAIDGEDVHIFVAVLSPASGGAGEHLKILAALSRLLKEPAFRDELVAQRSAAGILAAIAAAEKGS